MRLHGTRLPTRVLLVIAAVLYLGFPYEALATFPLDPSKSYLSELAASDQPMAGLFRLLDAATAVLVLISATVLLLRARGGAGLVRAATIALGVFAAATLGDVLFPMSCATSASVECARADAALALGPVHQIHTVTSVAALVGAVVSAGLLTISTVRTAAPLVTKSAFVALFGLLLVSSFVISAAALGGASEGVLPDGAGYVQRVQTALISVYLVCFAAVATSGARSRPEAA